MLQDILNIIEAGESDSTLSSVPISEDDSPLPTLPPLISVPVTVKPRIVGKEFSLQPMSDGAASDIPHDESVSLKGESLKRPASCPILKPHKKKVMCKFSPHR